MICQNPACRRVFSLGPKYSQAQREARKYCSLKCAAAVTPPPLFRPKRQPADRFWEKVDSSAGWDACWPWTGARDDSGYGLFRDGKLIKAHRYALKQCGIDPGELKGLHDCDNPPCCNPNHLKCGTSKDNAQDRERRGRGRRPGELKLVAENVAGI